MAEVSARLWLIPICAAALHAQTDETACRRFNDTQQAREAARCYEDVMKSAGSDAELARRALLGAARNRMWAGDSTAAARAYAAYVHEAAWDRAATLEYIHLLRYRGDYGAAEHWCDRLLAWNPADTEVLALRSEVLYWAGNRGFEALRNAEQARSGIAQAAALEARAAAPPPWSGCRTCGLPRRGRIWPGFSQAVCGNKRARRAIPPIPFTTIPTVSTIPCGEPRLPSRCGAITP